MSSSPSFKVLVLPAGPADVRGGAGRGPGGGCFRRGIAPGISADPLGVDVARPAFSGRRFEGRDKRKPPTRSC